MKIQFSRPWLKSASFDLSFVLLPSVISVGIAFFFANVLGPAADVPLWAWLIFIVGIDVSHVYSTLFRTYFNSKEFAENKAILTLIPLSVWLVGVALYSAESILFWRVLTYVAVFHFIRQQYGFLRLYTRHETEQKSERLLSAATIYLATIYPIIYWHCHQPRNFHWFIEGDFISELPTVLSEIVGGLYGVVLLLYTLNELIRVRSGQALNIPKNVIIFGTAISWYVGIVHFNGDLVFTVTNVVSHGIPYMALIWLYGERQKDKLDSPLIMGRIQYRVFFSRFSFPLFMLVLLFFAYLEEGLWAGFVWRDHLSAFGFMSRLPEITAKDTLAWIVPLLTLPQATHYVLDGFIWRLKDSEANWQKVLFIRKFGAH